MVKGVCDMNQQTKFINSEGKFFYMLCLYNKFFLLVFTLRVKWFLLEKKYFIMFSVIEIKWGGNLITSP